MRCRISRPSRSRPRPSPRCAPPSAPPSWPWRRPWSSRTKPSWRPPRKSPRRRFSPLTRSRRPRPRWTRSSPMLSSRRRNRRKRPPSAPADLSSRPTPRVHAKPAPVAAVAAPAEPAKAPAKAAARKPAARTPLESQLRELSDEEVRQRILAAKKAPAPGGQAGREAGHPAARQGLQEGQGRRRCRRDPRPARQVRRVASARQGRGRPRPGGPGGHAESSPHDASHQA